MRDAVGDLRPGLAVIVGLVDKRIPVVHLVEVNGYVSRGRVVARGFDVGERPPLRQVGNVFGEVRPGFAAVAGQLQQTIIGSRPDHAGFLRRFGNGEHHAGIFHADVIRCETAGAAHSTLVVAGQVRADDLPAVAAVGGYVHVLAAHVHLIMVVRRDRDRELPVEAILDFGGGRAGDGLRPDLDVAVLAVTFVKARDVAAYAAGAGAG